MMLKTLTEPPAEQHRVPLETAIEHIGRVAHPGSLIYMISDFMDLSPAFAKESGLSRLNKSCDVVFISINDAADQALVLPASSAFVDNMQRRSISTQTVLKGVKLTPLNGRLIVER